MIIPDGPDGTKFQGYCDNAHAGCIGLRTVRKHRGFVFCERCYRNRERLTGNGTKRPPTRTKGTS